MSVPIDKIVEELEGQCLVSLEDIIEREGYVFNSEHYSTIDERVFCCVTCGWWCPIEDMSDQVTDEWFCSDCDD